MNCDEMMQEPIKTVIVDNNIHSVKILETLIQENFSDLKIESSFTGPSKARQYLKKNHCDLLFLDVQMPEMNGFELLESLQPFKGHVIFITSYDKFAVEAFKYHALHYLVKPVKLKDLKEAVSRLSALKKEINNDGEMNHEKASKLKYVINKIGLHTVQGLLFIDINEVIRCEADGAYTNIFLQKEKILSSKNLKHFEDLLESRGFYRIHASHLINLNHIKKLAKTEGAYVVMSDGSTITIARRKKEEFIKLFERF